MKQDETMNDEGDSESISVDAETALRLLKLFKRRTGQKHSWNEVRTEIVRAGHEDAWINTGQKLANWENPKRCTIPDSRAYEAIIHFITSPKFQNVVPEAKKYLNQSGRAIEAGALVTEMAGIYPVEDTETIFFKALEGMWCDRTNLVYLYVHKVEGHDFAIVHLCQNIHVGYTEVLGFPLRRYIDFYASGYLYFENETHSKNKAKFQDHPRSIGEIEKFSDDSDIHRIGVSGKKMRLKLWSRFDRFEVNYDAFCESNLDDDGYEPCADKSISVSCFFKFVFNSTDTDDVYLFNRANYTDSVLMNKEMVKNIEVLKEEFDENKWSVLPNVSD